MSAVAVISICADVNWVVDAAVLIIPVKTKSARIGSFEENNLITLVNGNSSTESQ